MKSTVFLALAFAAIAAYAQKSYPECIVADCVAFLTITVGCGYSDTSVDITAAQLACICGAPQGPAEYQNCITCMNLDPTNTIVYAATCPAESSGASVGSTRTSTRTPSGGSGTTRTPTATQGTTPIVPTTAGGSLQGFGGCPNGDCGSGDSTKANIYDVSKDSNAVSGATEAVARGRGIWYDTGIGLAVLVGLAWL